MLCGASNRTAASSPLQGAMIAVHRHISKRATYGGVSAQYVENQSAQSFE